MLTVFVCSSYSVRFSFWVHVAKTCTFCWFLTWLCPSLAGSGAGPVCLGPWACLGEICVPELRPARLVSRPCRSPVLACFHCGWQKCGVQTGSLTAALKSTSKFLSDWPSVSRGHGSGRLAFCFLLTAAGEECWAQPPHRLSAQSCGSDGELTRSYWCSE